MAEVWLAEHKIHRRSAAIKILKPSTLNDADVEQLFRREGEVLAGFRNDNIVAIYDINRIDNLAYIVMEYLPAGSLLDRIRRGPISVGEAIGLIVQIANALVVAHPLGIIHRDLKPANVMMRDQTTPVLTDFGAARMIGRPTIYGKDGGTVGSPSYMSPEQISADTLDGRSDLYALGVMFYELLTGHVPFIADSREGVLWMHLNNPPPLLAAKLSILQPVMDRLLDKQPGGRFATAQIFIDALRTCFANEIALRQLVRLGSNSTAWFTRLVALGFSMDIPQQDEAAGSLADDYETVAQVKRVTALETTRPRSSPSPEPLTLDSSEPMGRRTVSKRAWLIGAGTASLLAISLAVWIEMDFRSNSAAIQAEQPAIKVRTAQPAKQVPINSQASVEEPSQQSERMLMPPAPARPPVVAASLRDRFREVSGSIQDTQTGLAWTQSDNGAAISWENAQQYCVARGSRLPSVAELQAIYDNALKSQCGAFTCGASPLFRLSNLNFWTSERNGSLAAWHVSLHYGYRTSVPLDGSGTTRALCVRRP